MKTKFNIKPSQKAQQFMQMAGVPTGLIDKPFQFDLQRILTTFTIGKKTPKPVTVSQQISWFHRLLTDFSPFTAVICSSEYYLQARQLASAIFWAHLQQALNHDRGLPLWHSPSNDFKHKLLDEYKSGSHAQPVLLALDNIYQNMPITKQDKVVELLQILLDRPRLLIYRGYEPQAYCVENFGVRPNIILQLGKTSEKKVVQL